MKKDSRTVKDWNGNILATEFKCHKCGKWVDENNACFANPKGGEIKKKEDAKPFCIECMPDNV